MSEDLKELFRLYVGQDAEPVVTAVYTTGAQDEMNTVVRQFENKTFKLTFLPDDPTEGRLDGIYNVDWDNQNDKWVVIGRTSLFPWSNEDFNRRMNGTCGPTKLFSEDVTATRA
jgi:hypothetical protein